MDTKPSSDAWFKRIFAPELSSTYTMTWDSGDVTNYLFGFASDVTVHDVNLPGRTLKFTTNASWSFSTSPFLTFLYTFADASPAPKHFRVIRDGDDGSLFTPQFISELNRFTGTLRTTKWISAAEQANGPRAAWGGGTKASPLYTYTDAARNRQTGGSWRADYNRGCAGMPVENIVALGNAYNGDSIWVSMPYNASDDYINGFATYCRDHLNVAKTIYVEFGNETSFNGVYDSQIQCTAESLDASTTAGVAISSIVKGTPFSLSTTCNTTSGSAVLAALANFVGVVNGMTISGAGIPAGTTIIANNGDHPTLSQNCTATATGVSVTITGCPATVTTSTPHGLTSTMYYASSGASPSDYNIPNSTHSQLTVVNSTSFTIMCATTPATNATVVGTYTHNEYPSFGTAVMPCFIRYIDASRRCADIWLSVFAGQTSRIKPVLVGQHIAPSVSSTAMSYANSRGWLTDFKAWSSAPYWTTDNAAGFKTYTGDLPTFFANCENYIATTLSNNAVSHRAIADTYGMEYVSYEGSYGQDIDDHTTRNAIQTDAGMYTAQLQYLQYMQKAGFGRLSLQTFVQPLSTADGSQGTDAIYGHIFPSLLGMPAITTTTLPKYKAVIDYVAGVRTPLPLSTTGLSVFVGAPNGFQLGTFTGKDLNSTLSLAGHYGNDGGILAAGAANPDGSVPILIADTTLLTTTGTRNLTVRDTNPGYPAPGYVDYDFNYTATAWQPVNSSTAVAHQFETSTTSCFTDAGGTTPVVNDGDIVRCIKDSTGTIIASFTSSTGPVYRLGAGSPYIEGNGGANQLFSSTSRQWSDGSGQHTSGAKIFPTANAANGVIIAFGIGTGLGTPLIDNNGTSKSTAAASPSSVSDSGPTISLNTWHTLSEVTSTTSVEAFVDGAGNGATNLSPNTLSFNTSSAIIVCSGYTGGIRRFAIFKGLLSAGDTTKFNAWLAA